MNTTYKDFPRTACRAAVLVLCVSLGACGGGSSNGGVLADASPSSVVADSEIENNPGALHPKSIALIGGTGGFILAEMRLSGMNTGATPDEADALLIDAEHHSPQDIALAKVALAAHKRVIVDSSATPAGRKAVALIAGTLLDLKAPYAELDAVILADHGNDTRSVIPIDHPEVSLRRVRAAAAGTGLQKSGDVEGGADNSAGNVLGFAIAPVDSSL